MPAASLFADLGKQQPVIAVVAHRIDGGGIDNFSGTVTTFDTTIAYNDEFPTVIAMLNNGNMKAEPLITRSLPLREALDTLLHFEEWGSTIIRTLIDMES